MNNDYNGDFKVSILSPDAPSNTFVQASLL